MPILKCKACGTAIDSPAAVRASRCTHCGTAFGVASSASPGVAPSVQKVAPDPWLRVLLTKIYCRTLVVLMIYALSTGPMYWAIFEAFRDNGSMFLARLYYPIVLACERSETIGNWFDWYVGLWVY